MVTSLGLVILMSPSARASCSGLATAAMVVAHSEKFPDRRFEMVTGYLRSFEVSEQAGAPVKAKVEIDESLFGTATFNGDVIDILIPWVDKSAYHSAGLNFFVIVTRPNGTRTVSECTSSGDTNRHEASTDIQYLRSLPKR